MQVPLQLNNYFFPIVSVVANPDFRPEQAEKKGPPLLNVEVVATSHDESLYEVQLDIRISSTDENPSQYSVILKAIGIFTVDADLENKEGVVKATGASILYSASRELLLTVMSRGPWAPIMLNLTAFRFEGTPHPVENPGSSIISSKNVKRSKGAKVKNVK